MNKTSLEKKIINVLKNITDLNSDVDIVKSGTLYDIGIQKNLITVILDIKNKQPSDYEEIKKLCNSNLLKIDRTKNINIVFTSENLKKDSNTSKPQLRKIELEGIKNIIVIASGKGGVGKSTITNNLAISMSKSNLKVGILDADIYGPSQHKMLGISHLKPSKNKDGKINTIVKSGIKCMSIGLLIDEDQPIIWRGPMVQTALTQLLKDVDWGELDVLLVDMPPGTGDAQLTISQKVNISGAIIVSTPQEIALIDAKKGLNMFKKVEVPIIGIIENMSFYLCPHCNTKQEIFDSGGAQLVANELKVPFLGKIPLDIDIRIKSDEGKPISTLSDIKISKYFEEITQKTINFLDKNKLD
ncbi:MAG: Iron-sulfur cluster carrier protein [Alphaproteobacteria bacterium MarineAlpha9_Bin1]|nr:MAG: Iron-sulfur cluster carrier protein [Alphaproteobacteria bacterium MarineAlpha9_Bin1]